ncbi:uncharacterized protein LOC134231218 [Saccostrea cucullata]|uniref:uncharacterized protein LOC134231218 n=1 Tax=Saccostrea cuccullata TaxID=36930 RepID=UPI002ECFE15E
MIQIAWVETALLVLMVYMRSADTASCPHTRFTMRSVTSCPKSKEEWDRRAEIKKCSLVSQQCGELEESVYHCVINNFANQTFEVCAPKVLIIGHSCVEYNIRGGIVQESQYVKCAESCPFSYTSTDVYKYQDCFKLNERKTWTEANATDINSNFKISRYSFYCLIDIIKRKGCTMNMIDVLYVY